MILIYLNDVVPETVIPATAQVASDTVTAEQCPAGSVILIEVVPNVRQCEANVGSARLVMSVISLLPDGELKL